MSQTLRIATYQTELQARGPALLLRDIKRETDEVMARVALIKQANPDVLILQGIDWDYDARALTALNAHLGFDHMFTSLPNAGMATGLDMDGDGQLGQPRDAQGYGRFAGHGGVAVLSKRPIVGPVIDLSDLLWRDLPDADLPTYPDGAPFPSARAQAAQRLSSQVHWIVPFDGFTLATFAATPPIFDGDEDRNGKRNADEIRLWAHLLDGRLDAALAERGAPNGGASMSQSFILAGLFNLDPSKGSLMGQMFARADLQDAAPTAHTAEFRNAYRLRLSYVLASPDITPRSSGVLWPPDGMGRHGLVWADVTLRP